jgi:hypothetical protein
MPIPTIAPMDWSEPHRTSRMWISVQHPSLLTAVIKVNGILHWAVFIEKNSSKTKPLSGYPMQNIYDDHMFDKWQNLEEVQICPSTIAKLKLQCMVLHSRILISMNSRN